MASGSRYFKNQQATLADSKGLLFSHHETECSKCLCMAYTSSVTTHARVCLFAASKNCEHRLSPARPCVIRTKLGLLGSGWISCPVCREKPMEGFREILTLWFWTRERERKGRDKEKGEKGKGTKAGRLLEQKPGNADWCCLGEF